MLDTKLHPTSHFIFLQEILGYNLVHWMSGHLPWMDNLANEEYVEAQKKGFMTDVKSFVHRCFGDKKAPGTYLKISLIKGARFGDP